MSCRSLYGNDDLKGGVQRGSIVLSVYFVQFGLLLLFNFVSLFRVRRAQQKWERDGWLEEAKPVPMLLPVYARLMWLTCFCIGVSILIAQLVPYSIIHDNGTTVSIWAAVSAFFQNYCFFVAALVFLSSGAGRRTFIRALKGGAVMSLVSAVLRFLYVFYIDLSRNDELLLATVFLCLNSFLFGAFYLVVWLYPNNKKLFRRPSLRAYSAFWSLLYVVDFIATLMRFGKSDSGFCVYFATSILWIVLSPWALFKACCDDSLYWQGSLATGAYNATMAHLLPDTAAGVDGNANSIATVLGDNPMAPSVAATIAHADSLGLPLVNFNALTIDMEAPHDTAAEAQIAADADAAAAQASAANGSDSSGGDGHSAALPGHEDDTGGQHPLGHGAVVVAPKTKSVGALKLLGQGSFARVYKGRYKDKPVAIKLIYAMELTVSLVHNLYREAASLGSLRSRYVVGVEGLCVMPPAVAMVMELCAGSLFNVIHGQGEAALAAIDAQVPEYEAALAEKERALAASKRLFGLGALGQLLSREGGALGSKQSSQRDTQSVTTSGHDGAGTGASHSDLAARCGSAASGAAATQQDVSEVGSIADGPPVLTGDPLEHLSDAGDGAAAVVGNGAGPRDSEEKETGAGVSIEAAGEAQDGDSPLSMLPSDVAAALQAASTAPTGAASFCKPALSLRTQVRLALDCCAGVAFLHTRHRPVVHLDIKSGNFLVGRDGVVKIADMELSTRLLASEAVNAPMPASACRSEGAISIGSGYAGTAASSVVAGVEAAPPVVAGAYHVQTAHTPSDAASGIATFPGVAAPVPGAAAVFVEANGTVTAAGKSDPLPASRGMYSLPSSVAGAVTAPVMTVAPVDAAEACASAPAPGPGGAALGHVPFVVMVPEASVGTTNATGEPHTSNDTGSGAAAAAHMTSSVAAFVSQSMIFSGTNGMLTGGCHGPVSFAAAPSAGSGSTPGPGFVLHALGNVVPAPSLTGESAYFEGADLLGPLPGTEDLTGAAPRPNPAPVPLLTPPTGLSRGIFAAGLSHDSQSVLTLTGGAGAGESTGVIFPTATSLSPPAGYGASARTYSATRSARSTSVSSLVSSVADAGISPAAVVGGDAARIGTVAGVGTTTTVPSFINPGSFTHAGSGDSPTPHIGEDVFFTPEPTEVAAHDTASVVSSVRDGHSVRSFVTASARSGAGASGAGGSSARSGTSTLALPHAPAPSLAPVPAQQGPRHLSFYGHPAFAPPWVRHGRVAALAAAVAAATAADAAATAAADAAAKADTACARRAMSASPLSPPIAAGDDDDGHSSELPQLPMANAIGSYADRLSTVTSGCGSEAGTGRSTADAVTVRGIEIEPRGSNCGPDAVPPRRTVTFAVPGDSAGASTAAGYGRGGNAFARAGYGEEEEEEDEDGSGSSTDDRGRADDEATTPLLFPHGEWGPWPQPLLALEQLSDTARVAVTLLNRENRYSNLGQDGFLVDEDGLVYIGEPAAKEAAVALTGADGWPAEGDDGPPADAFTDAAAAAAARSAASSGQRGGGSTGGSRANPRGSNPRGSGARGSGAHGSGARGSGRWPGSRDNGVIIEGVDDEDEDDAADDGGHAAGSHGSSIGGAGESAGHLVNSTSMPAVSVHSHRAPRGSAFYSPVSLTRRVPSIGPAGSSSAVVVGDSSHSSQLPRNHSSGDFRSFFTPRASLVSVYSAGGGSSSFGARGSNSAHSSVARGSTVFGNTHIATIDIAQAGTVFTSRPGAPAAAAASGASPVTTLRSIAAGAAATYAAAAGFGSRAIADAASSAAAQTGPYAGAAAGTFTDADEDEDEVDLAATDADSHMSTSMPPATRTLSAGAPSVTSPQRSPLPPPGVPPPLPPDSEEGVEMLPPASHPRPAPTVMSSIPSLGASGAEIPPRVARHGSHSRSRSRSRSRSKVAITSTGASLRDNTVPLTGTRSGGGKHIKTPTAARRAREQRSCLREYCALACVSVCSCIWCGCSGSCCEWGGSGGAVRGGLCGGAGADSEMFMLPHAGEEREMDDSDDESEAGDASGTGAPSGAASTPGSSVGGSNSAVRGDGAARGGCCSGIAASARRRNRQRLRRQHERKLRQQLGKRRRALTIPEAVNWLAPEFMRMEPFGTAADVYSLACVLWEIVAREVPFQELTDMLEAEEHAADIAAEAARQARNAELRAELRRKREAEAAAAEAAAGGFASAGDAPTSAGDRVASVGPAGGSLSVAGAETSSALAGVSAQTGSSSHASGPGVVRAPSSMPGPSPYSQRRHIVIDIAPEAPAAAAASVAAVTVARAVSATPASVKRVLALAVAANPAASPGTGSGGQILPSEVDMMLARASLIAAASKASTVTGTGSVQGGSGSAGVPVSVAGAGAARSVALSSSLRTGADSAYTGMSPPQVARTVSLESDDGPPELFKVASALITAANATAAARKAREPPRQSFMPLVSTRSSVAPLRARPSMALAAPSVGDRRASVAAQRHMQHAHLQQHLIHHSGLVPVQSDLAPGAGVAGRLRPARPLMQRGAAGGVSLNAPTAAAPTAMTVAADHAAATLARAQMNRALYTADAPLSPTLSLSRALSGPHPSGVILVHTGSGVCARAGLSPSAMDVAVDSTGTSPSLVRRRVQPASRPLSDAALPPLVVRTTSAGDSPARTATQADARRSPDPSPVSATGFRPSFTTGKPSASPTSAAVAAVGAAAGSTDAMNADAGGAGRGGAKPLPPPGAPLAPDAPDREIAVEVVAAPGPPAASPGAAPSPEAAAAAPAAAANRPRRPVTEVMRELIAYGHYRPPVPADTHPVLAELIVQGWHPEPSLRPTALEMYRRLLDLYQSLDAEEDEYGA